MASQILALSEELRALHHARPVGSVVTQEYHDRLAAVVRAMRDMGTEEAVLTKDAPPTPKPVVPAPTPAPTPVVKASE